LRQDWARYDSQVQLILSLSIDDLLSATGPVLLDTTMTEQQVAAGADDGANYETNWYGTQTTIRFGNDGMAALTRGCGSPLSPLQQV